MSVGSRGAQISVRHAPCMIQLISATDTTAFVDEVFRVIQSKAYIPGYVPPPIVSSASSLPPSTIQIPEPIRANVPFGPSRGSHTGFQESKKRSYNDRQGSSNGNDPHYTRGGRQIKQMRRGGRGGRGDGFGSGGRGGAFPEPAFGQSGAPMPMDFSNMALPQGMPFDPNDPIGAMMAMQSLGLPPLPGLPPFPQVGSPNGQPPRFGVQGSPLANGRSVSGIRGRCRDYDMKGFCTRGDACHYLHDPDRIVVPGSDGALYSCSLSILLTILQSMILRTPSSWIPRPFIQYLMATAMLTVMMKTDR